VIRDNIGVVERLYEVVGWVVEIMGEEVAPSVLIFLVPSYPKHDQVHGPIGELGRMPPRYFCPLHNPISMRLVKTKYLR
jgi:hypothetical protein